MKFVQVDLPTGPVKPLELHRILQEAYDTLQVVRARGLAMTIGPDTAFALGEALGTIAKAKALVGRDVDQLKSRQGGQP